MRFATSARTILAGDRDDASSEAEAWLSLARALLPICRDEAAACFEYGLALLETRLGDESRDWLDVLSGIADSSGQTGNPQPQLAYRLARVAESVHERYDHKFPWEDIAQSLAHLCLTSALAIASRWADRRKADLSNILASLLPGMVSQKQISVNQALSLHLLADNWNRAKLLDACLSRETDRNQQDFLLDLFVRELSLSAPNLPAAEKLQEVADRHGLASPILDQLLSRPPDPETRREREDFARYQRDPQEPLVLEGDFTCASDIDQAMESWRQNSRFHFRDDVVRQIAATVPANRKVQHLRAWLEVKSLSAVDILFALQDIAEIWGDSSMAVAQETPRLIRKLTEDRAEELLASGYSIGFLFGRRGRENRQALDIQLSPFVEAAARGATHLAAKTFFDLTQEATRRLDPQQACEVLDFGLARIETMLGESDGDGPWRPELAPPTNVHEAVAGLLWARLAAPEAEQRWQAAHAVRRLCLPGEQACVDALLARIESESGSVFVDHRLPFYWLHARLYLLIALARATKESPSLLQPHAEIFSRLALASIPHVLIRAFAAEAALALESALHGTYSEDTLKSLRTVNQSPFSLSSEKTDRASQHRRESSNFHFEIDLEPYWFAPLGVVFGISKTEVTHRVEHWVTDRWKEPGRWQWDADPRSNIYHERETSHSHGSYPKTDRLSFYLAYHAMFCVAGEFLSSYPVLANQWEPDPFAAWLHHHNLARTDGEWLADRRDPWPIQRRPWQSEAQSDTWRWEIGRADFESVLDINDGLPDKLPIWGNWNFSESSKVENIHIFSALVSESSAHALLHALQTASNPHDYYLPDARDHREIRQGAFRLTGWVRIPRSSEGLDHFDPFAGRLPYPPPLPGKSICRIFDLKVDTHFREWLVSGENSTMAFTAELWGDRFEANELRQPEHGSMLYVTSDFLRRVLSRLRRCLILEVQISRRVHGYRSDGEEIYPPPYFRLFLVDADGKIQSL